MLSMLRRELCRRHRQHREPTLPVGLDKRKRTVAFAWPQSSDLPLASAPCQPYPHPRCYCDYGARGLASFAPTTITAQPGLPSATFLRRSAGSRICQPIRRYYQTSVDLEKEEKIRLTTIRLYRILQRFCRDFNNTRTNLTNPSSSSERQRNDDDGLILLQPNLEAPDWGRHSIFTAPTITQVGELFRLFYVWNDFDDDVDEDGATGRTKDTTTVRTSAAHGNHSSSIDDWYYELVHYGLVRKRNMYHRDDDSDGDETPELPPMTSETCWTTPQQLREAVRMAFRAHDYSMHNDDDDSSSRTPLTPFELHRWAIRALHMLQEQQELWSHSSVATTDGIVRVTATSRCIGTTSPAPTIPPSTVTAQVLADMSPKYRFAYRIRVENISHGDNEVAVQLLGRYWSISERTLGGDDLATALSPPIVVNAPVTGAVGQLPVLLPGQVFEYMSGADLAKPLGSMRGHLYMAIVPANTPSAKSGDDVEALKKMASKASSGRSKSQAEVSKLSEQEDETHLFEAEVAPFPLDASRI